MATFICVLVFWMGVEALRTKVDLSKSIRIQDQLEEVVEEGHLYLYTESKSYGFAVIRTFRNYRDIIKQLETGQEVILYHKDDVSSNDHFNIYQLEQHGQVLYSIEEYEAKKEPLDTYLFSRPSPCSLVWFTMFEGSYEQAETHPGIDHPLTSGQISLNFLVL